MRNEKIALREGGTTEGEREEKKRKEDTHYPGIGNIIMNPSSLLRSAYIEDKAACP